MEVQTAETGKRFGDGRKAHVADERIVQVERFKRCQFGQVLQPAVGNMGTAQREPAEGRDACQPATRLGDETLLLGPLATFILVAFCEKQPG